MRKDVYLHEEGGGGFTDNLMQIVKVVPLAGTNVALRGITKEGGDVERGGECNIDGFDMGFWKRSIGPIRARACEPLIIY